MGAKRAKKYRKLMHQYELAFNFREPYQVLVDAEMIKAAAQCKMRLGKMLEKTLHGEIKPMITQCCIRHLYNAEVASDGDKATKDAWIDVAKQADRRRCGHHELDDPLSALDCIMSVVDPKGSGSNKHRYVVATQELDVRRRLREVAGVPLIYIHRSVMILEPMAEKTEDVREQGEKSKIRAGLKRRRGEDEGVTARTEATNGSATTENGHVRTSEEPDKKKQRKARGPKAPNPLSVKKSRRDKPTRGLGAEVPAKTAVVSSGSPKTAEDGITESISQPKRRRKRKQQTDGHGGATEVESGDE